MGDILSEKLRARPPKSLFSKETSMEIALFNLFNWAMKFSLASLVNVTLKFFVFRSFFKYYFVKSFK